MKNQHNVEPGPPVNYHPSVAIYAICAVYATKHLSSSFSDLVTITITNVHHLRSLVLANRLPVHNLAAVTKVATVFSILADHCILALAPSTRQWSVRGTRRIAVLTSTTIRCQDVQCRCYLDEPRVTPVLPRARRESRALEPRS